MGHGYPMETKNTKYTEFAWFEKKRIFAHKNLVNFTQLFGFHTKFCEFNGDTGFV
jgi:hypothetical protein